MTGRSITPPPAPPPDVARLRVALWKIAGHIGIDLDSSMADHEIAELAEHRLAQLVEKLAAKTVAFFEPKISATIEDKDAQNKT